MTSYSAWQEGDKLISITKIEPSMTATDKEGMFFLNALGDWFYFIEGNSSALYSASEKGEGGTIVRYNQDSSVANAFEYALLYGAKEATIIKQTEPSAPPISNETQEQITNAVSEKIILQPILQPIQTQCDEVPIIWATSTLEPQFEEVATYAETWTWQNIAQPLIARGIRVFNDNIPQDEVRPREYVVISVDDEIRDVNFSGNTNNGEESLTSITIQGKGNTFQNYVVEISKFIHNTLREHRKQGTVYNISNRSLGYDTSSELLSRSISFWLTYIIE